MVSENTYGGTYRLFEKVLRGFGLDFTYVDTSDALCVEEALRPETRLVFLEIPTNPVMTIADLRGIAGLTQEAWYSAGCRQYVHEPLLHPADRVRG